jgi:hypothetical protein
VVVPAAVVVAALVVVAAAVVAAAVVVVAAAVVAARVGVAAEEAVVALVVAVGVSPQAASKVANNRATKRNPNFFPRAGNLAGSIFQSSLIYALVIATVRKRELASLETFPKSVSSIS